MPEQGWNTRQDEAEDVERDEQRSADRLLNHGPEKEQGDHVEQQVHQVAMQKSAGDELIPLVLAKGVVGTEHAVGLKAGHHGPGKNRGRDRYDDKDDSNG